MGMKKYRGITLIELLIVVAIIGLLIVTLFAGIRTHLIRAHDAERKADIKKISQALEQYYNDHGGYPGNLDNTLAPNSRRITCGNNTVLSPYMKDVPCDPGDRVSRPYLYLLEGSPHTGSRNEQVYRTYRLLTALEYKADPQIDEMGCPEGCGNIYGSGISDTSIYNFGIAANTTLDQSTP